VPHDRVPPDEHSLDVWQLLAQESVQLPHPLPALIDAFPTPIGHDGRW
jgi:hypothetical protein